MKCIIPVALLKTKAVLERMHDEARQCCTRQKLVHSRLRGEGLLFHLPNLVFDHLSRDCPPAVLEGEPFRQLFGPARVQASSPASPPAILRSHLTIFPAPDAIACVQPSYTMNVT